MTRKGPITVNSTAVPLGLGQLRIGASAANIGSIGLVFTSTNSIGALAESRFVGEGEYYELKSGFPQQVDKTICIRESCALEVGMMEITSANMALAYGLDPTTYTTAHTGVIGLGAMSVPSIVRAEMVYTFPDTSGATRYIWIVLPRAQVKTNVNLDLKVEGDVSVMARIEARPADSEAPDGGGNAVWDSMPLGYIRWVTV